MHARRACTRHKSHITHHTHKTHKTKKPQKTHKDAQTRKTLKTHNAHKTPLANVSRIQRGDALAKAGCYKLDRCAMFLRGPFPAITALARPLAHTPPWKPMRDLSLSLALSAKPLPLSLSAQHGYCHPGCSSASALLGCMLARATGTGSPAKPPADVARETTKQQQTRRQTQRHRGTRRQRKDGDTQRQSIDKDKDIDRGRQRDNHPPCFPPTHATHTSVVCLRPFAFAPHEAPDGAATARRHDHVARRRGGYGKPSATFGARHASLHMHTPCTSMRALARRSTQKRRTLASNLHPHACTLSVALAQGRARRACGQHRAQRRRINCPGRLARTLPLRHGERSRNSAVAQRWRPPAAGRAGDADFPSWLRQNDAPRRSGLPSRPRRRERRKRPSAEATPALGGGRGHTKRAQATAAAAGAPSAAIAGERASRHLSLRLAQARGGTMHPCFPWTLLPAAGQKRRP